MAQTYIFNAKNEIQRFTVPEGILSIHIDCIAPKGNDGKSTGGKGGRVQCDMHVTPGQTLYIVAGMSSMTYNASDIRTNNAGIIDANSLNSRLIVAGGGGDGASARDGSGTGGDGGNSQSEATGGTGGGSTGCGGGSGGTQTSGGTAGSGGGFAGSGNAGTFALGGERRGGGEWGYTGKGGAGWYGGGSGGQYVIWDWTAHVSFPPNGSGGGGGGGSSYTAVYCSNVQYTRGYNNTTNGKVIISHGDPVQPTPIDIDVNAIITYDDLISDYITWLRMNCANVDGYSSSVTPALISGYSSYISGTTVPVKIIESTVIPTVSNATCQSQLNAYLIACGLASGSNAIIKSADILKYYNALAAFSAAKLVTVCSQFASNTMLMYKASATIPTITKPTDALITGTQVKNLSTEFINFVNRNSKMHVITYIIQNSINAIYYPSDEFYTVTIPSGITKLKVDCVASAGTVGAGDREDNTPGKGGRVQCTLAVTPGQTLYIYVGNIPPASAWASGGIYNASDIRTNNAGITDTTSLNSRLIVAGGGGSARHTSNRHYTGAGGNGGGLTGADGTFGGYDSKGGTGGTQSAGGSRYGKLGLGGGGTTSTAGGAGGAGYYGGGAGTTTGHNSVWYTGGGGGGSSYTNLTYCSNVVHTQGYNDGIGYVAITSI